MRYKKNVYNVFLFVPYLIFLYVVERFCILSKFSSNTSFTVSLTDVKNTKYSYRKESNQR